MQKHLVFCVGLLLLFLQFLLQYPLHFYATKFCTSCDICHLECGSTQLEFSAEFWLCGQVLHVSAKMPMFVFWVVMLCVYFSPEDGNSKFIQNTDIFSTSPDSVTAQKTDIEIFRAEDGQCFPSKHWCLPTAKCEVWLIPSHSLNVYRT